MFNIVNNAADVAQLNADYLDWCYTPIIQSGGAYDLKPSAVSDERVIEPGVVLVSAGVRYRNYCSNISRTYLIDPPKVQEYRNGYLNVH
jgi:nucleosome binding factor SPN SPT16 subunit